MKTVHFFRHGQTHWNLAKKFQGHEDISLTYKGIEQAENIARLMKEYDCSIGLSSPLKRAVDTMNIVFDGSNIKRVIHPSLIERDFGSLTGEIYKKAISENQETFDIMDDPHHPNCYKQKLPGGESKGRTILRVLTFVQQYFQEHKNIAVSTHGGILQYIIMAKNDVFTHMKNCEIVSLSFDEIDTIVNKVSALMES